MPNNSALFGLRYWAHWESHKVCFVGGYISQSNSLSNERSSIWIIHYCELFENNCGTFGCLKLSVFSGLLYSFHHSFEFNIYTKPLLLDSPRDVVRWSLGKHLPGTILYMYKTNMLRYYPVLFFFFTLSRSYSQLSVLFNIPPNTHILIKLPLSLAYLNYYVLPLNQDTFNYKSFLLLF